MSGVCEELDECDVWGVMSGVSVIKWGECDEWGA